jgi:hypothetical protein
MLHSHKLLISALVLSAAFSTVAIAAGVQVAEAKLGTGVQDRMVTGEATSFAVNDKVYVWLKLTGGPSDDIKVTWKMGDYSDSTALKVGGDPWRTWANKTVFKAGAWTVMVTDAAGATLKELTFDVK